MNQKNIYILLAILTLFLIFNGVYAANRVSESINENMIYSDIENHWAKENILEFTQNEILNGYSDNTFRPNENVTVAEFMKMVICARRLQTSENRQ
ncbi:MAG: S-layer homology domain-containing protein [Clostridia bacterium]|nr:S-layer homology domain-containing protein [Clostridia bacterium]